MVKYEFELSDIHSEIKKVTLKPHELRVCPDRILIEFVDTLTAKEETDLLILMETSITDGKRFRFKKKE